MSADAATVGALVRHYRAVTRMSQEDVAQAMAARGHRWRQTTLYKIEQANRNLLLTEASDLADVLGTTLNNLAGLATDEVASRNAAEALRLRKAAGIALNALRDVL